MLPTGSSEGDINQNWNIPKIPENKSDTPPEGDIEKNQEKKIDPSLTKILDQSVKLKNAVTLKKDKLRKLAYHSKDMSELFSSSRLLTKTSEEKALPPHNPQANNANDVYMTKFSILELTNRDVVFKPGGDAALRSKICFGLVRLYSALENVIVAAKSGHASVISRKDYNVRRTEVFNPENGHFYLIQNPKPEPLRYKKDHYDDFEEKNIISGKLKGQDVELEPVDENPGFYKIHSKKDLDDCFCMRVSKTLPSGIDKFVENKAAWVIVKDDTEEDSTKIYLIPFDEMIKITIEETTVKTENESIIENRQYVTIDKIKYALLYNEMTGQNEIVPVEGDLKNYSKEDSKRILENYSVLKFEETISPYNWDSEEEDSLDFEESDQSNEEKKEQILVFVPKSVCVPYSLDADSLIYNNKIYDVEQDKDGNFILSDNEKVEENEHYVILGNKPKCDLITIKNGKKYVKRNNQDYQVTTEGKSPQIIGKNIDGMVQLKVENIFQKNKTDKHTLDILHPSEAREEFYKRIDMGSYIQAFIATILLRPQDGKISDLGESNVLFQAMPFVMTKENGETETIVDPLNPLCPLCPIIIDLDETMPPANDYSQNPDFIGKGQAENIHAVRNGLMGFPQARVLLSGDQKLQAEAILKEIILTSPQAIQFLETLKSNESFNDKHIAAYKEVIDRMDQFLLKTGGNDWSLEQLFFFVFPEYQEHWEAFGDMSPEDKAINIGFVAPDKT